MDHALVADIGGTHARIGLVTDEGNEVYGIEQFSNKEFASLEEVIRHYLSLSQCAMPPKKACFAVASPVLGDDIRFTNNSWSFNIPALKAQLAFDYLHVMNDFEAIARSLPFLCRKDLAVVAEGRGAPVSAQTMAVLGPGTGLGMSAAIPDGKGGYVPLPSEGGHAAFAPQDERERWIHDFIKGEQGFVCIEDVVSGQGLENIYRALATRDQRGECRLSAKTISDRALIEQDPLALESLSSFCSILGTVSGDLALTTGARGGVYLAGGILPRFLEFLDRSPFRRRFEAKGRYASYVSLIPTYVIIGTQPGLIGAASLFDEPK